MQSSGSQPGYVKISRGPPYYHHFKNTSTLGSQLSEPLNIDLTRTNEISNLVLSILLRMKTQYEETTVSPGILVTEQKLKESKTYGRIEN